MPPLSPRSEPPSRPPRGRRSIAHWLLTAWVCVALLGAQAAGWIHGVSHAAWSDATGVAQQWQPAADGDLALHDCLLFDACSLGTALVAAPTSASLAVASYEVQRFSLKQSAGQATRLAFRSQAPPSWG